MPNNVLPANLFDYALALAGQPFEARLAKFAEFLLDTPYGSPEPSEDAKLYNDMLAFVDDLCAKHGMTYSFDRLDCVTYVETVLALAYIEPPYKNASEFKEAFEKNLKAIRFNYGIDTYIFSNHVTSYDWCPNNNLLMMDATKALSPNSETAQAKVNKAEFFYKTQVEKKFPEASIDYLNEKLNNISDSYQETLVKFPYIKTKTLVDNYDELVESFPKVSVVSIVRPGWDLVKSIGTQLNVSHMGFAFKVADPKGKHELMFMHATSVEPKKVVILPLKEYMAKYLDHDSIKGINIQGILPGMKAHLESQAKQQGYYLSKIHPVKDKLNKADTEHTIKKVINTAPAA